MVSPDTRPTDAEPDARRVEGPLTLAIDIGGSRLKASVLDAIGCMVAPRARLATPDPASPAAVVPVLVQLAGQLPAYDRVSVGFPGVVREGVILTAPNLGTAAWAEFDLAGALRIALGKDVRIVNDADMQGLAAIEGRGLEMVVTLGTGCGTALYRDGCLMPHLELGQHPIVDNLTYDMYIGDRARRKLGSATWNRRVAHAIDVLRSLVNFDRLHIGGGNAKRLTLDLPTDARIVDNTAGILGGIALWQR
jgi:polyphosphate glucokinase